MRKKVAGADPPTAEDGASVASAEAPGTLPSWMSVNSFTTDWVDSMTVYSFTSDWVDSVRTIIPLMGDHKPAV